MRESGRTVRGVPAGVAALALAVTVAALAVLPVAGRAVGPHSAFLPAFFSAVLLLDLLSAWLLVTQFLASGRPRLLVFASAYAWCVASVLPHALSFPGVLSEDGLIGAPATATWLWTTWHTGFAVLLAAGALPLAALDRARPAGRRRTDLLAAGVALALGAGGVAWAATSATAHLPTIIVQGDYASLLRTLGPWIIGINVVAVVVTLRHAVRARGLQAWFVAVALTSLGDVVLTLLAQARYTVGWYAGRTLSLVAAGIVLLALVGELTRLYARLETNAEQLRRLADVDDLTGLLNRRAVLQVGESLAAGAPVLSVAVVDVDRFKAVNDTHGHTVGDQVLFSVAGRLTAASRAADAVGRYGGEEFLLLLPGADLAAAREVAGRVRAAIAAKPVVTTAGRIEATASIGVAQLLPGEDLAAAIEAADAALYEAKRTGRDRVVAAERPPAAVPRQERRGDDPASLLR